ncbi:MAG: YceI family protein [Aurantibacter sp.]
MSFFSHSIVEDIKADNNQVLSIIDTTTHKVAIQLLMRSFMFEKALMQEHFNENYVESYKYPKATFSGEIRNFESLDAENTETEIVGKLTVHGETKDISAKVNVKLEGDEIVLEGDFKVEVADFNIKIPAIVRNNIAKTILVTFELHHKPYN